MPTTDRGDHSSRSSSFGDDGDSSGDTGVHLSHSHSPRSPRSVVDSHELNDEGSWVVYPDELGPSDSASRPHTSNRERPLVEAPQPEEATRRPNYRRRLTHDRVRHSPRVRRSTPTESESVDSHEDWQGYARGPSHQYARPYPHYAHGFPTAQYQSYPQQSLVPIGQQQVVPYGAAPLQPPPVMHGPNYFAPQHQGGGPPLLTSPGAGYASPPSFYPYHQQGYPVPHPVHPHPGFPPYPAVYSPPSVHTPPPSSDTSNKDDEKFARLEKLLIDQRQEQAAKEAAAEKAAQEKAAQEEADAKKAAEIKAASDAAATAAKEEAEKEHKAAEEKKQAEAEAAAAAAAAAAPPKEKDKPLKFKDAVGRKFSFPFHLCCTWSGMEFLIKEAFMHIEGLGPHVAEGHYDLLGPHGEIILPHVWETVIEPDWTITMHMWPMNDDKEVEAAADDAAPDIEAVAEGVPPPPPPAPSPPDGANKHAKKSKKPSRPSGFMLWTANKKTKKGSKSKKK